MPFDTKSLPPVEINVVYPHDARMSVVVEYQMGDAGPLEQYVKSVNAVNLNRYARDQREEKWFRLNPVDNQWSSMPEAAVFKEGVAEKHFEKGDEIIQEVLVAMQDDTYWKHSGQSSRAMFTCGIKVNGALHPFVTQYIYETFFNMGYVQYSFQREDDPKSMSAVRNVSQWRITFALPVKYNEAQ